MMKPSHQKPKEVKIIVQLLNIDLRDQTDEHGLREIMVMAVPFAVLVAIAFLPMNHAAQIIGGLIQTALLFFDRARARG